MDIAAMISSLPQPHLSAPAPAPAPIPAQLPTQPPASTSVAAPVACNTNRVPEHLMHKNRLQEYAQRSYIPLPIYQCHNEGYQHAPKFRASVLVDGVTYTSPNTFSHRKAAEQDVAKLALESISKKIKDEGCPLINEDTIFCKSILNEFAVKMNLEMPAYCTRQSEALLPIFVSSLFFDGITYTGETGRSKKEAEQLAARAVIRTLLVTSGSATILSEIIKSKVKLYAALNKVKESNYSFQNIATSNVPTTAIPESSTVMHPTVAITKASAEMHPIAAIPEATAGLQPIVASIEATAGMQLIAANTKATAGMQPIAAKTEATAGMQPIAASTEATAGMLPIAESTEATAGMLPSVSFIEATAGMHPSASFIEATAGMHPSASFIEATAAMHPTAAAPETRAGMNLPHHLFKIPKMEPSSATVNLPIAFVPPVLEQPSVVGPSSTNKRRKNKKKANKKLRTDAQACVATQPLTQVPPCSVAQ